ncbi:LysR family transcriptional regulator [Cryomorpha ignava]|uniref:LysR family transcriptional regulator n=1 Tax=Cryomorpha ignava TaxID=101383 RepID=A0A7K3WSU2_9FLAO|nr:LysR family transcriptional regulator [Cryomorpha ignava]NEN23942.1 LysR family transcriptional regulator [Cryomorpha ignava]
MNYTLNQLQIFLKITETSSITLAAEALFLTQPAVSIQLKNFQQQFELPLTELIGRRIFITDFGKEIAESAARIIEQVYEINYKSAAHKGEITGKLKISIVSTGKYVMPYFLSKFIRSNPGVELVMDVTNKERVIQSLEKNEVDFSLVSVLPESLNIEKLDLLENELYLIGNSEKKHKKRLKFEELFLDLPLIFREKGSGTRQTMEKFLKSHKLSVLKKMELTSNEAVKQAVLAGLGYSIMPLIGVQRELDSGEMQIVPVKGLPIKTMWSLIWLKGKKHSSVAKAFLKYLEKEKENIVKEMF